MQPQSWKACVQKWCDKIEEYGQHYVDKFVYLDCGVSDSDSLVDQCPSLSALDWRDHIDVDKINQAQGFLALAQLACLCSNGFFDSSNKLLSANVQHCKEVSLNLNKVNTFSKMSEVQKISILPSKAQPQQQKILPKKLYQQKDLVFERRGPYGNKGNSIFKTPEGHRLYVKDRHLKERYDSFLVSYLTSKLGEKLCPGQIIETIAVVNENELRIGSLEIEGYVGAFEFFNGPGDKKILLSLVLDLMSIRDRGRKNLGYSSITNLASAVDVDLGGFRERSVVDQNLKWINLIRQTYGFLGHEFKEALLAITKFSDGEIKQVMDDAELELRKILPAEHHKILSTAENGYLENQSSFLLKARVVDVLQQMRWLAKNFDNVNLVLGEGLVGFTDTEIKKLIDSDEYGFFLWEAIRGGQITLVKCFLQASHRSYENILIYASFEINEKGMLQALWESSDNFGSVKFNFEKKLKEVE